MVRDLQSGSYMFLALMRTIFSWFQTATSKPDLPMGVIRGCESCEDCQKVRTLGTYLAQSCSTKQTLLKTIVCILVFLFVVSFLLGFHTVSLP